jgi:HAD superfamily hydrolase (TIGR01549 family)
MAVRAQVGRLSNAGVSRRRRDPNAEPRREAHEPILPGAHRPTGRQDDEALHVVAPLNDRQAQPRHLCHCSVNLPGVVNAHKTLDRLKELGVKLALITNGAAEPRRAKVVRFALEHRFDHIQIEGEHGFGKPEEWAYTHAMEVLGADPHETWMIGDNLEWEIVAPQRLGIYAIWHDGYGVGLSPNSPARPDRIIRHPSELLL